MSCDLENYLCSDRGLILPLVSEYSWAHGGRAVLYGVGLFWSFMAVSIIADIFMAGIETITSKTQKVKLADPDAEDGYTEIEIKTWNGTVANLTLMALGASGPESMLSLIEVLKNSVYAGDLGPGIIVGSSAFKLMCITGVCILVIPPGEVRKIKHIKVFAVTAIFHVLAYLWLIVILMVVSPDYVDVWEAVVTILMFPAMVILSYMADKDYCSKKPEDSAEHLDLEALLKGEPIPEGVDIKADKRLILEFVRKLKHEKGIAEKDVAAIVSHVVNNEMPHSRGWYRRNAIKNMTGSAKLDPQLDDHSRELLETMLMTDDTKGSQTSLSFYKEESKAKALVEFAASSAAVMEKDRRVKLTILRHGNLHTRVVFKVETCDGTAEAESDYIPVKKCMVFTPNQTSQDLEIEIVDDNIWEPDEVFFVKMSMDPDQHGKIGKRGICQVTILNDDDPGTIEFPKPSFLFPESVGIARIPVSRINGADGVLNAKWRTKDISAIGGRDYENTSGEIEFKHGEVEKNIEIIINDDMEFEKDENFEIIFESVSKGAKLGRRNRTIITIVNDDEFNGFVSRIADLTNANLDAMRVDKINWGRQFVEAMNVNGGDLETATVLDYVMHFFTFGWKLIFAFVPPPSIWGGWLCFFVGLAFMGFLTAIIGDLASIFGCLIGLKDAVTAITFVALGTSLPDLFASKTAAMQEKTADNSIGNVTGSNGVNVFLGIGLSWFLAACYWTAQGKTFEVPAGDLGFSVTVFTCCALVTIALILVRRYVAIFGGELGGPKIPKIVCGVALIVLWVFYVLMASMQAYEYIGGI